MSRILPEPRTFLLLAALLCASSGCMQDLVLGESREEDVVKIEPEDTGTTMDVDMAMGDLSGDPYLFEPAQMAYAHGCDDNSSRCFMQTMLIDVDGRLACLTSEDYDILPAQAGRYMVTAHELPEGFDGGCPVGDYLIERPSQSYCPSSADTLLLQGLEYGWVSPCLAHYEWGDRGEVVRRDVARSGLIVVSSDGTSCTFDFELIFQMIPHYRGSFSIPLDELPGERETLCVK